MREFLRVKSASGQKFLLVIAWKTSFMVSNIIKIVVAYIESSLNKKRQHTAIDCLSKHKVMPHQLSHVYLVKHNLSLILFGLLLWIVVNQTCILWILWVPLYVSQQVWKNRPRTTIHNYHVIGHNSRPIKGAHITVSIPHLFFKLSYHTVQKIKFLNKRKIIIGQS